MLSGILQNQEWNPLFIEAFLDRRKIEMHPQGSQIIEIGKICRKIYFVAKGTLRFFYYDNEGNEITHWFLFEGDFITEVSSFFEQKESDYYLEALEDCELHAHTFDDITFLLNQFPEMEKIGRIITTKSLLELGEKLKDLQFRDAKSRYDNLLKKHPNILQKVPLGHIASYLGITQQSLSRIRRQK